MSLPVVREGEEDLRNFDDSAAPSILVHRVSSPRFLGCCQWGRVSDSWYANIARPFRISSSVRNGRRLFGMRWDNSICEGVDEATPCPKTSACVKCRGYSEAPKPGEAYDHVSCLKATPKVTGCNARRKG